MTKKCLFFGLATTIVLALLFWISNRSENVPYSTKKTAYSFQLERTFEVNSLNPVILIDYYPPQSLYLGYTIMPKGLEITIVNEKGEITISKNMEGEGPEEYTSSLNFLAFSPEGNIWAITNIHILQYNQQLHNIEKAIYSPNILITTYDKADLLSYFNKDNSIGKTSFIINPNRTSRNFSDDDFHKSNLIEIYEWGSDSTYEIAPIPDRNISGKIDVSIAGLYTSIYTVDKEKSELYLTGSLDNEITVYDLNTGEITKRIQIEHGDFLNLNTDKLARWDIPTYTTSNDKRILLLSKNDKLFKLDNGILILDYITTISEGIFEQKKIDNPRYLHYFDPEYHKLIIFDNNKQTSTDLAIPENGTITASLPGNRLLVKKVNKDSEEDYISYSIYKLVEN